MRIAGRKTLKIAGKHKLTNWRSSLKNKKFFKWLRENPKGRGLN